MKYLPVILFIIFFPATVFAARMVQGTVPQVQPLQPPAVGVDSNVSGNINYTDANGGTAEASSSQASSQKPESGAQENEQQGLSVNAAAPVSNNNAIIAGIIFVVVVAGAAFGIRKYLS